MVEDFGVVWTQLEAEANDDLPQFLLSFWNEHFQYP